MGTYRLILALCVVVGHASPLGIPTLDAGLAVKTFFMISGFYMALVLTEKYPRTPEGRTLFYTNRLLRIYPMYFVTLAFAILFYAAASLHLGHPADRLQLWSQAWHRGSGLPLVVIALSQGSVLGLDLTPLFGFSPTEGFHLLSSSAPADSVLAWRLNFLPHCWSIGAELFFYALAPRLVTIRPSILAVLAAVGFGILFWIQSLPGPLPNSANYHLGLLQLPYFVMGILAYSSLGKLPGFKPSARIGVGVIVVLAALTFSGWPAFAKVSGYAYLSAAWLTLPVLFNTTRTTAWDRWVGELSYPIYLLHVPVKWVLLAARGVATKDAVEISGWALLAATLAAAGLMVAVVDRPLERYRRSRLERSPAGAAP